MELRVRRGRELLMRAVAAARRALAAARAGARAGRARPGPACDRDRSGTSADLPRRRPALRRRLALGERREGRRVSRADRARPRVLERLPSDRSRRPSSGPRRRTRSRTGRPWSARTGARSARDALVEGELARDATQFQVEFRVWDTARCTKLLRKRYPQAATADAAVLARRIADDVVEAFVGVRGVSAHRDRLRLGSRRQHRDLRDERGRLRRRAPPPRTARSTTSRTGRASGESILYTSYRLANRPLLFLSTPRRAASRAACSRGSADRMPQYRGVFAPLGPTLAVVMSDGRRRRDLHRGHRRPRSATTHEQPRDRRLARAGRPTARASPSSRTARARRRST